VTVHGVPEDVQPPVITAETPSSLHLSWSEPSRQNGIIQRYHLNQTGVGTIFTHTGGPRNYTVTGKICVSLLTFSPCSLNSFFLFCFVSCSLHSLHFLFCYYNICSSFSHLSHLLIPLFLFPSAVICFLFSALVDSLSPSHIFPLFLCSSANFLSPLLPSLFRQFCIFYKQTCRSLLMQCFPGPQGTHLGMFSMCPCSNTLDLDKWVSVSAL